MIYAWNRVSLSTIKRHIASAVIVKNRIRAEKQGRERKERSQSEAETVREMRSNIPHGEEYTGIL